MQPPPDTPASPAAPAPDGPPKRGLRLVGWAHPEMLAIATLSLASGFAQFGTVAALPDIATAFQAEGPQSRLTSQLGLSGATIGIGLGLIRLAAAGSLPLARLADHVGRRRVLIPVTALGLAITVSASLSASFWWFVALFALARPLLSTTNALTAVLAAEETRAADRSFAIALVSGSYGLGAGLVALVRGVFPGIGFRGLFALSAVTLAAVPFLARRLRESDRFTRVRTLPAEQTRAPRLGHVRPDLRGRLAQLWLLAFAVAFVSAPLTGYLFVYAEKVIGLSSGVTATVVLAAGPLGLAGLLAGRWAADHVGRRPTAALGQLAVAIAAAATYQGGAAAAIAGYLLNITFASVYAPAFGALSAEVFPTSMRATAAGWLTVAGVTGAVTGLVGFGLLADALGGFTVAARTVATPLALSALLYLWLPETRGQELEESAPESP